MNIHPSSIVCKEAIIGKDVFIGPFCNLQKNIIVGDNTKIFGSCNAYDCKIGSDCKIGTFVEIQNDVTIGNNCKIQSHTFICEGVIIESGVFISHNVVFINDMIPRAINIDGKLKTKSEWKLLKTTVGRGASIGSGAVVFPVKIGKWALIGAGYVLTNNIPDFGLAYGSPAKLKGFVCKCGSILELDRIEKEDEQYTFLACKDCRKVIPVEVTILENTRLRHAL